MTTKATKGEFQKLLERTSSALRPLVAEINDMILSAFPSAVVSLDAERLGYGVKPGYKGLVFVVEPQREWVNLGFVGGATLHDPAKLLQGSGKVHRHVKIKSTKDLRSAELRTLIRTALAPHHGSPESLNQSTTS